MSSLATLFGSVHSITHSCQLYHVLAANLRSIADNQWALWLPSRVVLLGVSLGMIAVGKVAAATAFIWCMFYGDSCDATCTALGIASNNGNESLFILLFIASRSPEKCCGLFSAIDNTRCVGMLLRRVFLCRRLVEDQLTCVRQLFCCGRDVTWISAVLHVNFWRERTIGARNGFNVVRGAKWRIQPPPKVMLLGPRR